MVTPVPRHYTDDLVEGDQPIPYPETDDPLVVSDETGAVIFALRRNGTVEMPDPAKAADAAAIFWREVLILADELGIQVVTR